MRMTRHLTAVVSLTGILAAASLGSGALASAASSPARASALRTARAKTNVLLTMRTVVPKIQRTVHFTGYATYSFRAPSNRRIVSASARIVGAKAHAVEIHGRTISSNRETYTVSLVFPGEQGNPGKLVVRLVSAS
jgi:hypothetical protein